MQNFRFLRGWVLFSVPFLALLSFFHAKFNFLARLGVFLSKIRHFSSSKTSVFGWVRGLFEKKNDMCACTSSLESRLKELETEAEVVAAKSIEEKRFEKRWRSTSRRSLRALVKRAGRQWARVARISRPWGVNSEAVYGPRHKPGCFCIKISQSTDRPWYH